ncbi:hypothetical protein ZWY2020_050122 [Hordeum vulgare]|nr:hypothetical protein ZWY2020_050122 [Hordeum vulgare]
MMAAALHGEMATGTVKLALERNPLNTIIVWWSCCSCSRGKREGEEK